jgi:hypothetical protein
MVAYLKKVCIMVFNLIFNNTIYVQEDGIDVFVKAQMQKRGIPGLQLEIK